MIDLEIILAKTAGFCFGVKRAVDMVYNNADNENVYTYGPIIHNEQVVADLEKRGVKMLPDREAIKNAPKGTVIIRAHGILQEDYKYIEDCGHEIVDATCPFVLKIHKIVKEAAQKNQFIVIIGDKNHPEVQGIKSCAGINSVVINSVKEAQKFINEYKEEQKEFVIVSQTTFNYNKFQDIVEIFQKKDYYKSNVLNTICNATEERQKEAAKIAKEVDAMIVVGGRNSSNTQKLFEICSGICKNTFFIETADDMDYSLLSGMNKVGITAGASTPNIIIEEVQTRCQI